MYPQIRTFLSPVVQMVVLGVAAILLFSPHSVVQAQVQETILFEDDFEFGILQSEWTARPNLDGGSNGIVDVVSDVQGFVDIGRDGSFFAAVIGKTTDSGPATTNALDLTLDLSGETDVELVYWLHNRGDETDPEDGIFFSDDGGTTFTKVFDYEAGDWNRGFYGKLPPLDVSALAADNGLSLTNQFVIRWQQRDDADFSENFDEDGFWIDDVVVRSRPVVYATLPFADGFESGRLDNAWRHAFPTNTFGFVRIGGLVEVTGEIEGVSTPQEGSFAAVLGRRTDGQIATNALDLHLNLSGETDVELLYRLYDFGDENQPQDGIWFSDDGGETFLKVYTFDAQNWTNYFYGQLPPLDVDGLAQENGLTLTDRFVIRFQQHDDADFVTNFDEDGIFLDDILVRRTLTTNVTPPFRDDFEAEPYGDRGLDVAWSLGLAEESTPQGVTRLGGFVSETEFLPRTGSYSTQIGRRTDGLETAVSLELNLDLSAENNVALRFWLTDFFDEFQDRDGIWLSDDAGANFIKVFDIDPTTLPNQVYRRFVLDLDELAAAEGLGLTDEFAVRIQQNDNADFVTSFDEDGWVLDDVLVLSLDAQVDVPALTSASASAKNINGGFYDFSAEADLTVEFQGLSDDTELLLAQDPASSPTDVGLPPIPDNDLTDPLLLAQPFVWTTILEPVPTSASVDLCFALSDIPPAAEPTQWVIYQFGESGEWTLAPDIELRPDDMSPQEICTLGTNGQGDFVVSSRQSVLPVELARFDAVADAGSALLQWETLGETDNSGFRIEHQRPGASEWASLAFVPGAGTTTDAQRYRFRAEQLSAGTHRFRLQQLDLDGTRQMVGETQVSIGFDGPYNLSEVYPNPSRQRSTMDLIAESAQNVRVEIFNLLGQHVLMVYDGPVEAGTPLALSLDTAQLASGVYFARVQGETFSAVRKLTVVR